MITISITLDSKGNGEYGVPPSHKKCIIETNDGGREELLDECMRAIGGIGYSFPYTHYDLMEAIDYIMSKNDNEEHLLNTIEAKEKGESEILIEDEDIDL